MKRTINIWFGLPLFLLLILLCCTREWDDHFIDEGGSVKVSLWDTLSSSGEFSEFVKYMELFHLDTVVKSELIKTLFVPTNEAFAEYLTGDTTDFRDVLTYHIVPTYYMVRNIGNNSYDQLKTYEGKYALIENVENTYFIDGIEIVYSSPMHLDGKYYLIEKVVVPKPNIYQYIKRNNNAIRNYIDLQDTLILDKELSRAIGFNEYGQTIYDSVTILTNRFEEEYFAISKEYKNIFATVVIPGKESYEMALDDMARDIGGSYTSFEDIPDKWENDVLIPALMRKGVYGGLLESTEFLQKKLLNVAGDSVCVDFSIDPGSKAVCSNGIVYKYESFIVGDSLYKNFVIEAEDFVRNTSSFQYAWIEEKVTIAGDKSFRPTKEKITGASNDTIVNLSLGSKYAQEYSIKLKVPNVFPRKYRLVWRTNYRTTGLFSIYVNGELVKLGLSGYEQYDTYNLINGFFSVMGYKIYPDKKGFCDFDGWVENITEFGDITIELKYLGSGAANDNGYIIDYLTLEAA
jgi:hypothetical protein